MDDGSVKIALASRFCGMFMSELTGYMLDREGVSILILKDGKIQYEIQNNKR